MQRGRGGRGRGRGRVTEEDRKRYNDRRDLIHTQWNNIGRTIRFKHFNLQNNPVVPMDTERTTNWYPFRRDFLGAGEDYPWQWTDRSLEIQNNGIDIGEAPGIEWPNDLKAAGGMLLHSGFRTAELDRLQMYAASTTGMVPPGWIAEAKWGFMGMNNIEPGPAWSTFHYALSDLYIIGLLFASQICGLIMEICEDAITLAASTGHQIGDRKCYLDIEGKTDAHSESRSFFTFKGLSLNEIRVDPTELFERIISSFKSEGWDILFRRVFIHVLTDVGRGGSLEDMPYYMQQMRNGMFYKDVKGYQLIPDTKDNLCGLEALVWGMSNAFTRIQKMCNKTEKTVPEICIRFKNYRSRIYKGGKKEKKLLEELKYEMVQLIDYVPGYPLSHDQLCHIISVFAEKKGVDIGLVIFDAIHPLSTYSMSYDPKVKVPQEVICLIHWNYQLPIVDLESKEEIPIMPVAWKGHYDCINQVNITKWLTMKHPTAYSKNLRFSFRSMSLLTPDQADDKGNWCFACRHWQKVASDNLTWSLTHGFCPCDETEHHCDACGVSFNSQQCMDFHAKKSHGLAQTACETQFYCAECKKVHSREKNCGEWYCKVCYKKYPNNEKTTHVCFLRPSSTKKSKRLELVIYADMEGCLGSGHHTAVCISCCWTTICEEHKKFRNSKRLETKKKCQDCLLHTDNWDWFCDNCVAENGADEASNDCPDCLQKHFKYFSGSDCLIRFLDWVMSCHLGATVAFHNGGKYDLHILVPVILSSGKYYIANDANRSTQIIFMTVGVMRSGDDILEEKKGKKKLADKKYVHFKDSLNFIQSSLRNFNDMFQLGSTHKGRFPYNLLNIDGWENWNGTCPDISFFGIQEKELKNQHMLSKTRKKEIKEIIEYIKEQKELEEKEGKRWNVMDKLKEYTLLDTEVLHDGVEIFRKQFWTLVGHDPLQYVTLPAAVAGAYRSPAYMPEDSIQIFSVMDREWQHRGLRGGRCEMFKAYWKKTKPSQKFRWVDINSEYPDRQAYGFFPMGAMTLELKYANFESYGLVSAEFYRRVGRPLEDVLMDPSGTSGCGLIECEFQTANDVFIPILPCRMKGEKGYQKNMFQICSSSSVFFLTVVAAAVKAKQIILTGIKRLQYWKTTSDQLFQSYMCQLYAAKVQASGWKKIFNDHNPSEEEKIEYIKESKKRGIVIEKDEVMDNPGMRTTAKIMNNCGWGFLCKKLTTNETHYFNNFDAEDVEDMVELITDLEKNNGKRMVGNPVSVENYTKVRSTKVPELVSIDEMDKRVAYHVGGQVPAYGLQKISEGLLSLHPSQVVYCDTDSIAYVYDSEEKEHKEIKTGIFLGDYVDEYPNHDIEEFVSTGCKSYYVKMRDVKNPEQEQYKGRFKGIPFNSAAFSLTDENKELAKLGMEEMKNLLFNALERQFQKEYREGEDPVDELTYEFHYTNFFKRGPDHKIKAVNEHKTVRFTYDKRKIILPDGIGMDGWRDGVNEVNTLPINDHLSPLLTSESVTRWIASNLADRLGEDSLFE